MLFFWRFDEHTAGPWGRILHYHRIGAGHLPVRDVFGLSPSCVARIKAKVARWWDTRKTGRALVAEGLKAAPELRVPAGIAATPGPIKVVGRTDLGSYTFGIGGSKSAVERSIAAGTFTGFRKASEIKPRPWSDSLPKPQPPGPNPPRPNPTAAGAPPTPRAPAPRPTSFAPRPPAPLPKLGPSTAALHPRPSSGAPGPPTSSEAIAAAPSGSVPPAPEAPPTSLVFEAQSEAETWGDREFKDWSETLSDEDKAVVASYIDKGYQRINKAARGKAPMDEATAGEIERLKAVLARGRLKEPIVVWRWVRSAKRVDIDLDTIQAGERWRDKGFTSTSLLRGAASEFGGTKSPLLLRIELDVGQQGAYLNAAGPNAFAYQAEFLLPPSKYVIVGVDKSGSIPVLTIRPLRETGGEHGAD